MVGWVPNGRLVCRTRAQAAGQVVKLAGSELKPAAGDAPFAPHGNQQREDRLRREAARKAGLFKRPGTAPALPPPPDGRDAKPKGGPAPPLHEHFAAPSTLLPGGPGHRRDQAPQQKPRQDVYRNCWRWRGGLSHPEPLSALSGAAAAAATQVRWFLRAERLAGLQ